LAGGDSAALLNFRILVAVLVLVALGLLAWVVLANLTLVISALGIAAFLVLVSRLFGKR
jgi:hypothetical protein